SPSSGASLAELTTRPGGSPMNNAGANTDTPAAGFESQLGGYHHTVGLPHRLARARRQPPVPATRNGSPRAAACWRPVRAWIPVSLLRSDRRRNIRGSIEPREQ